MLRILKAQKTPLLFSSFQRRFNSTQKFMYEREIRASLSKLERLSVLLPETEPQKKRAEKDL